MTQAEKRLPANTWMKLKKKHSCFFFGRPNSAVAAALLSGGSQLEALALSCWGAAALLSNAAVLALLLCVALDAGGARQALCAAAGLAYLVYFALCLCNPLCQSPAQLHGRGGAAGALCRGARRAARGAGADRVPAQ